MFGRATITLGIGLHSSCIYILLRACVVLQHGEVDLVGLKPIRRTTTSFSALTLSVGSFDP